MRRGDCYVTRHGGDFLSRILTNWGSLLRTALFHICVLPTTPQDSTSFSTSLIPSPMTLYQRSSHHPFGSSICNRCCLLFCVLQYTLGSENRRPPRYFCRRAVVTPVFKESDGLVGLRFLRTSIGYKKKARKCEKAPEIIFGV